MNPLEFLKLVHCSGTKTHVSQGVTSVDIAFTDKDLEKGLEKRLRDFWKRTGGKNIFYGAGIDPDYPAKRHGKMDVMARKSICIDFDIRNNFKEDFNKDCEDAYIKEYAQHIIERINDHPIFQFWHFIFFTGNGLHLYYLFEDLLDIKEQDILPFEYSVENFMINVGEWVKERPDLATKVLSQPLRVPGSINDKKKSHKETKVIEVKGSFIPNSIRDIWIEKGRLVMLKKDKERQRIQDEAYERAQAKTQMVRYSKIHDDPIWDIVDAAIDITQLIVKDKGWTAIDKKTGRGSVTAFKDANGKKKGVYVINPPDRKGGVVLSQDGSDHFRTESGCGSFNFIKKRYCNDDFKQTMDYLRSNYPEFSKYID